MKHSRRPPKKSFNEDARKKNYNPTQDAGLGSYNIIAVKAPFCTLRAYIGPWKPPKK